jgi:hypothetical protein
MVKKKLQVPLYCQLQKFSVLIHLGNNHLTFTGLKGRWGIFIFYFMSSSFILKEKKLIDLKDRKQNSKI